MIRHARESDFEAVRSIKAALGIDRSRLPQVDYRFSLQKSGFLLYQELEWSEFKQDLLKTFLVYEVDGTIIGYLRVDTEQEIKPESNVTWFKKDLKSTYFAQPHADIGTVAVSPITTHRGVGTALLEKAEEEIKGSGASYLFSLVVLSPITNVPSLLFHEKHGFERVAVTGYPELFGLENYQSILYGKKLQ